MKKKAQKIEDKKVQFHNPAKSTPGDRRESVREEAWRKEEKRERRSKYIGSTFVTFQGIFSLIFLGGMFSLGILPFSYELGVLAVVAVLFFIIARTQKGKKVPAILGRIFCSLFLVVLIAGSVCFLTADHMLRAVTGAPFLTEETKEQTSTLNLLGSGHIFTITEDTFSVYIRDASEEIDGDSESAVNQIATINPETRQVLVTTIPGEYYLTIPGVSGGQKELLSQTGTYGVEATMTSLETLYETDISYYLKLDFEWITEKKEAIKKGVSKEFFTALYDVACHIGEHVRTNMTKEEVQELCQQQIERGAAWHKTAITATGTMLKNTTFSSPDTAVYVMNPDQESVSEITKLISRVEDDEILKK